MKNFVTFFSTLICFVSWLKYWSDLKYKVFLFLIHTRHHQSNQDVRKWDQFKIKVHPSRRSSADYNGGGQIASFAGWLEKCMPTFLYDFPISVRKDCPARMAFKWHGLYRIVYSSRLKMLKRPSFEHQYDVVIMLFKFQFAGWDVT